MSHQRLPPPGPEDCLIHSRVSRYRGGTLIAEDVPDLATHRKRLADPDGYRPARCPRCGCGVLHLHDYPKRGPLGEVDRSEIRVARHICVDCQTTWRILPAFLACCLPRRWHTVERTVSEDVPTNHDTPRIPKRTVQRWRARLASAAKQLVVLLATTNAVVLEAIAKAVGLEATRRELVDAHAQIAAVPIGYRVSRLAALVHRLERGIRLM